MRQRTAKPEERIFIFKVIQSNSEGMIREFPCRVLAVPEKFTLYGFAEAITESFGFFFDHSFGFYSNMKRYYDSREGYELFNDDLETRWIDDERKFPGVKKTPVNRAFKEIGKKMLFLFDYGDEWHFRVELKSIEPARRGKPYPVCIQSVGEARSQYDEPDEEEEIEWLSRIDHEDDSDNLADIMDHVDLVELFVSGITPESFLSDARRKRLVLRSVRTIAEAARNLSPDLRARYPDLWSRHDKIYDLLVSGEGEIDPGILWEYSTAALPI